MVVWRPLAVVGKLDHTMPLVYRLATAEPVQGSPFHLWTCSCASVAGGPVLVWACPLIPDGVPVWPSVLLWKHAEASAGCWLGCPCGNPAKCPLYRLSCLYPSRLVVASG